MPRRATSRNKSGQARRDPATSRKEMPDGTGGRPRDQWAVEDITTQVLQHVVSHVSFAAMAKAMGQWMFENKLAGTPEPMPRSTLQEYVARAREQLKEIAKEDRKDAIAEATVRVRRIAHTAFISKSFSAAVQAENLLSDIQGTKAPKVLRVGGEGGGPIPVKVVRTSDERRRRIAELQAIAEDRAKAAEGAGRSK